MPPDKLRIRQAELDRVVEQARSSPDEEICGLLGGKGEQVEGVFPVPNNSPTPAVSFLMDDQLFVDAYFEIENRGWELIAIYHSHPAGVPPFPSSTDIANANYPDALHFIVSVDGDGQSRVAVFTINESEVHSVSLEIVSPRDGP